MLVIIPDDNYMYIGQIIKDMKFERISYKEIKYKDMIFNKVGEGNQYIKKIEFGNLDEIEGNCEFEDYECEDYVISLGILTDNNVSANIFANILFKGDMEVNFT